MSTLNVSNITDGTTTVGTSYVVNGSAKAWINMNGQGTIAARDSLNVSSLTDNGTGDYTVNFSSAMADANYSIPTNGQGTNINVAYTFATASFKFFTGYIVNFSGGGSPVDSALINGSVFGELA